MNGLLLKNAIYNIAKGSSAAVIALLLPSLLTRILDPTKYGSWMLVLQLSAYTGYLDLGIQTAVARFVAQSAGAANSEVHRIASTATVLLSVASVCAVVLIGAIGSGLHFLFPDMPTELLGEVRLALWIVGIMLAIGLPFAVPTSIFIGYQNNKTPALIASTTRLLGAALVVLAAWFTDSLVYMAGAMAISYAAAYCLQLIATRQSFPNIQVARAHFDKGWGKTIIQYSLSLTVTTITMLMVTGLDTTLVGIFSFNSIPYFAAAASLISFIFGIQAAITSVLVPVAANLQSQKKQLQIQDLLITYTRYCMFLLLVTGLPLIFGAKLILRIWLSEVYAINGSTILSILCIANIVRLSLASYAALLVGTGEQKLALISPLAEGLSNLVISIVAGYLFGALGVAIGTLIGSIIGVITHFLFSMVRAKEVPVNRTVLLNDGLLAPLLFCSPLIAIGILLNIVETDMLTTGFALLIGIAISICLLWYVGINPSKRIVISNQLRAKIGLRRWAE